MPSPATETPSTVSAPPAPSKEELFASQLVGEMPHCPECSKMLKRRHADKCSYCGFHFGYLERILPTTNLPPLERITDFGNNLNDDEILGIESYIKKIESRYPQFHLNYCLLPLQKNVELQQIALWMLNQCPTRSDEELAQKKWSTLVIINTSTKKSAIATGYMAEAYLPTDSLWQTVQQLNDTSISHGFNKAIHDSLDNLLSILDFSKKQIKRSLKKFKKRN